MHPELLSLSLFMLGTSCSPGPNNIVASYSGFNFGVVKTFPNKKKIGASFDHDSKCAG